MWLCHWEIVGCGGLKEEGLGSSERGDCFVLYSIPSIRVHVSRKLDMFGGCIGFRSSRMPWSSFSFISITRAGRGSWRALGTLLILVVGLVAPWMALSLEHGWSKIRGISLGWGGKCLRCCLGRVKRGGMPRRMNKC